MNCLEYALDYWSKNPKERIWYDHNHCINLPEGIEITKFTPLESYGYNHISNSFNMKDNELLKKYFMLV